MFATGAKSSVDSKPVNQVDVICELHLAKNFQQVSIRTAMNIKAHGLALISISALWSVLLLYSSHLPNRFATLLTLILFSLPLVLLVLGRQYANRHKHQKFESPIFYYVVIGASAWPLIAAALILIVFIL